MTTLSFMAVDALAGTGGSLPVPLPRSEGESALGREGARTQSDTIEARIQALLVSHFLNLSRVLVRTSVGSSQ